MDDLAAQLAGSFSVTREPNQTSSPHPRYSQYKLKSTKHDQESRRAKLLEIQKSRRFNFTNHVRKLTEGDWSSQNDDDEEEEVEKEEEDSEEMEVEVRLRRPGQNYKSQLMMSEWLVEVPADFATNWLAVLCPVAKRCLVVASRGKTRAFSKGGYCLDSHPSHLPGGSYHSDGKDSTIIDCLYSEANQTYYILDLMCWNGHTIYESETEFRFYWLHEKMQEFTTLGTKCKGNPYKFVALPSFRCVQSDIATAVANATFEIDGLLFFHKATHYTFGSTPLVVWLKPYMLSEILDIDVPVQQMSHRPTDYTCYNDHVQKWKVEEEEKTKKLEERRLKYPAVRGSPRGRGSTRGRGSARGRGRGKVKGDNGKDMEVAPVVSDGENPEDLEVTDIGQETNGGVGEERDVEINGGVSVELTDELAGGDAQLKISTEDGSPLKAME